MLALRSLALLSLCSTGHGAELGANPIRKVVTMIQQIQAKVSEEGVKEKELFDKYMCYCQNGAQTLGDSIGAADQKAPLVEGNLKASIAKKGQLEAEVAQAKKDREDTKSSIDEATSMRAKEKTEFDQSNATLAKYQEYLKIGIAEIKAGAMGSAMGFIQSEKGKRVRQIALDNEDLSNSDRDSVMSFLSSGEGDPGPAIGILSQMLATFNKNQKAVIADEEAAIKNYDELVAAKKVQIETLTQTIQAKLTRAGELGVEISTIQEDLADTQEGLAEDQKFLADLKKNCATKEKEWDIRSKTRSEELLALADTIKILNDDDALELFKKTLPGGAQLLQTEVSSQEMRKQALAVLKTSKNFHIDLISLALKGKKVSFDKVLSMIDKMVTLLGNEQASDDEKKSVCEKSLDENEDALKTTETKMSDLEKAESDANESLAALAEEIAALNKGLSDLDKQVEDATYNRKEENEDYKILMQQDGAAKEIIAFAKNRLQKFYNPSMYKAPPKRELSMSEKFGFEFIQIRMHSNSDVAPPPPPETFDAYSKQGEASNGVMVMMDTLVADLDKEMQEADVGEKDAQAEYEQMMKDAAEKRIADAKSIQEKEGAKADTEAALLDIKKEHGTKMKEAFALVNTIGALHKECDFLLQNYDTRKQARSDETDALNKAKAVLSGADFSLLQKRHFLKRVQR